MIRVIVIGWDERECISYAYGSLGSRRAELPDISLALRYDFKALRAKYDLSMSGAVEALMRAAVVAETASSGDNLSAACANNSRHTTQGRVKELSRRRKTSRHEDFIKGNQRVFTRRARVLGTAGSLA